MFLEQGWQVRALARSAEKAKRLLPPGMEVVECDLLASDIARNMPSILEGCEAVLHLATSIPSDSSAPNAWEANSRLRTEAVRMLLDASLQAGVRQYIQQSITMAYPDCGENWVSEDTPLDSSPERVSPCGPVIAMEGMLRAIPTDRLSWCILRGGSFVGPGTFQERAIENLRLGREVIPCHGQNFLSLIHVADIASATVAALQHAPAGSTFNIVDEPLRQHEYYDRLAASIGAEKPRRDVNSNCPPSWRCTNQHARSVLNWRPTHSLIPA